MYTVLFALGTSPSLAFVVLGLWPASLLLTGRRGRMDALACTTSSEDQSLGRKSRCRPEYRWAWLADIGVSSSDWVVFAGLKGGCSRVYYSDSSETSLLSGSLDAGGMPSIVADVLAWYKSWLQYKSAVHLG